MKHRQGFIALTSVLIVSAVFLSISIGMASRAISGLDSNVATYERDRARFLAEACVEYALMELERVLEYTGDENLLIGEDSCEILVIEGEGNTDRTVKTQSSVGMHAYRIEVVVGEVSPNMAIVSYERVAQF